MSFRTERAVWEATVSGEDPVIGWGTVTALRLYDLVPQAAGERVWERPLEMLVRF